MTKGHVRAIIAIFLTLQLLQLPLSASTTVYTCTSSSFGQFNSTPIPGGSSIWFTASLEPSALPTSYNIIAVYWYMISFGQQPNGLPYECHDYPPVNAITWMLSTPEAEITYWDSYNHWTESLPIGLGGGTFLAGCTIPPCSSTITSDCIPSSGLPGGLPVTWTMTLHSTYGQQLSWQWGAAVYSQFAPCSEIGECQAFGPLGIKAVDSSNASLSCVDGATNCQTIANSDRNGTPENYKQYLIAGGTSSGGTNYTGTSSATQVPCYIYQLNDWE
jgi:hypothetical protein